MGDPSFRSDGPSQCFFHGCQIIQVDQHSFSPRRRGVIGLFLGFTAICLCVLVTWRSGRLSILLLTILYYLVSVLFLRWSACRSCGLFSFFFSVWSGALWDSFYKK